MSRIWGILKKVFGTGIERGIAGEVVILISLIASLAPACKKHNAPQYGALCKL
jgi:peroxiredoxin